MILSTKNKITPIYAPFDNEQLEKDFVNGKLGDSKPIQSDSNYVAFLRENFALLQN